MEKEIENIIAYYCEGISHLEFSENDFPEMTSKIKGLFEKENTKLKEENEMLKETNSSLQRFRIEDASSHLSRETELFDKNKQLEERVKELEGIIKEAINLPKGIEPHSYSNYLTK